MKNVTQMQFCRSASDLYLEIDYIFNVFTAGLPGLDDDGVSGSTQGPDTNRTDEPISIEKMMVQHPRYVLCLTCQ